MAIDPTQSAEWRALALEASQMLSHLGAADGPVSDDELEAVLGSCRTLSSEVVPALLDALEIEQKRTREAVTQAAEAVSAREGMRGGLSVLRKLEWVGDAGTACPECGGGAPNCGGKGHAVDCPLGMLLKHPR